MSNTTSPSRNRSPSSVPSRSVSAGELVTRSSKVVVAAAPQADVDAPSVDHPDRAVAGQLADRAQTSLLQRVLRADAYELGLFPARQRILQRRPCRALDVLAPQGAADAC